jgi:hypothetical protein
MLSGVTSSVQERGSGWPWREVAGDAEVARFCGYVVEGPRDEDCSIWVGGIGADGYPRYFITRQGVGLCVRPNRYALALTTGTVLGGDVFALHECDNPVCVKVSPCAARCRHVVAGTQQENMERMARARRGGGRPSIRGIGRQARRARSVALREAVRHGWDEQAVQRALLGADPTLW